MPWPWIIVAIAVVGIFMLVCFGIWLVHKASDVLAELRVLGERAGQGVELLGRLQLPGQNAYGDEHHWDEQSSWYEDEAWQQDVPDEDHDPDAVVHRSVPTT